MKTTYVLGGSGNKGNVTSAVFDKMVEVHGMGAVCAHVVDYEAASFSDGFIGAVRRGLLPIMGSEELSPATQKGREYHHFLLNDECYVAYFD